MPHQVFKKAPLGMDKRSTEQLMVSLLSNYQQLVVSQLNDNPLVGEYLTESVEDDVRLLCQMRTIIFLIKTADLFSTDNINRAEKLYSQTEAYYLKDNKWQQQLNNEKEATLYSYAFVILAQAYLYKSTRNPLYAVVLAETFSRVETVFRGADLFKPLSDFDCLEQNAAMHLFEALTFAYHETDAVYMQNVIDELQQLLLQYFWQAEQYVLAEKVLINGTVLTYEAGHWFEWVSLLNKIKKWGAKPFVNNKDLYLNALQYTHFTGQQCVINEMDSELQPLENQKNRIWPNLEYLRAKAFMEEEIPMKELNGFIQLFFDDKGLPKEYLESAIQGVKSTTGYHIAEAFIDILQA